MAETDKPQTQTKASSEKKPKTEDRRFHYPTHLDPMRSVPGTSQYLDDVQRETAERLRAKVEEREPDYDNPPATQSTPLVEEARLERTNVIPKGKQADVTLPVSVE